MICGRQCPKNRGNKPSVLNSSEFSLRRSEKRLRAWFKSKKPYRRRRTPSWMTFVTCPDSDSRASLLLTLGSLGWKGFEAFEHADFLLTFKEENFSVMFQFFNNFGWWILALAGAVWFIISIRDKDRAHKPGIGLSLLLSSSFISLMFGLLLAVKVTGAVPSLVSAWGGQGDKCWATVSTQPLASFSSGYKLALICGASDPTIDTLDDNRIMISNLFSITGGPIEIVTSETRHPEAWAALTGKFTTIWHMPVLLPNGVGIDKITTLGDVRSVGERY